MNTNFSYVVVVIVALFEMANCRCADNYFECHNGTCIPEGWVCDGINDCGDAADEPDICPPCGLGRFQCNNGNCIGDAYLCDLINTCGDWSDEKEEACPCSDNEFRCPSAPGENSAPGLCIPPELICDPEGIWDCLDGSDEVNCTRVSEVKPRTVKL